MTGRKRPFEVGKSSIDLRYRLRLVVTFREEQPDCGPRTGNADRVRRSGNTGYRGHSPATQIDETTDSRAPSHLLTAKHNHTTQHAAVKMLPCGLLLHRSSSAYVSHQHRGFPMMDRPLPISLSNRVFNIPAVVLRHFAN